MQSKRQILKFHCCFSIKCYHFQGTTAVMLFAELYIIKIIAILVKAQTNDCDFRLFLKTLQSKTEKKI